jgi:hypothetical protein
LEDLLASFDEPSIWKTIERNENVFNLIKQFVKRKYRPSPLASSVFARRAKRCTDVDILLQLVEHVCVAGSRRHR